MSARAPQLAEVFHPSVFIEEELSARGWTRTMLAALCSIDEAKFQVNFLALDLYLGVGENNPGMYLGEMADQIARAFRVSPELLHNLERVWRDAQKPAERQP